MSDIHKILIAFDATRIAFWGLVASLLTSILYLQGSGKAQKRIREPPCAPASTPIPIIGHAIGMLSRRMQYFADIGYEDSIIHKHITYLRLTPED